MTIAECGQRRPAPRGRRFVSHPSALRKCAPEAAAPRAGDDNDGGDGSSADGGQSVRAYDDIVADLVHDVPEILARHKAAAEDERRARQHNKVNSFDFDFKLTNPLQLLRGGAGDEHAAALAQALEKLRHEGLMLVIAALHSDDGGAVAEQLQRGVWRTVVMQTKRLLHYTAVLCWRRLDVIGGDARVRAAALAAVRARLCHQLAQLLDAAAAKCAAIASQLTPAPATPPGGGSFDGGSGSSLYDDGFKLFGMSDADARGALTATGSWAGESGTGSTKWALLPPSPLSSGGSDYGGAERCSLGTSSKRRHHGSAARAAARTKLGSRNRLTRGATSILESWLSEHRHNPYPSHDEKAELALACEITFAQVNTWFTNARVRKNLVQRKLGTNACPPAAAAAAASGAAASIAGGRSSSGSAAAVEKRHGAVFFPAPRGAGRRGSGAQL